MPKVGKGSNKKEFEYTEKGKEEAEKYAEKTGQEVEYPTYDAGGRVKVYREGGKVKPTSASKTSIKFQGTSKDVAKKMAKDPEFKAGMEKYYGMTLNKKGKLSKK